MRVIKKFVHLSVTTWGPSCLHFIKDLTAGMWSIVLTSLRLRPLQTVEPLLVKESLAVVENAEKPKEKKKKSGLDKMNAYKRKRMLKTLKGTKDNIVESNDGKSTDNYDADERWDGHHREEKYEEHETDSRSNVDSGHERQLLGPEVEGNLTSNHVVVEEPDVAAPVPLERRERKQSSSSSPSSRLPPPARSGKSRRQKRNAKTREQKKTLGTRTDKGKKRIDAKEKQASDGQDRRPADDSEMPENGVVDHVEVIEEEVVPSSHYPLVRSMYGTADDDHMLYNDLLNCVVKDEKALFRHGFPRRFPGGLDVVQFTEQQTPLKRAMSNPASTQSHFTAAAAISTQPLSAPSLQNSTYAGYESNSTAFLSSQAIVGYENLNYNTMNGNLQHLALSSRPYWEGEKRCCRCGVSFTMTPVGVQSAFPSSCIYHWDNSGREEYYKCCGKRVNDAPGCTGELFHVYQHIFVGVERLPHPYHGFISTTRNKKRGKRKASRDVVSLDCEMVYTVSGMSLAQVVVVDVKGFVIYSTYVRPQEMIFSYNTEHSGVRKEDLEGAGVKKLSEVQKDLQNGVISDSTIVIGHALHNDLKVLKILHNVILDTKILYGYTGIKRLSSLSSRFLNLEIQNSYGHDCLQDARAALDLALRFVGERKQGSKENFKTM